MSNYFAGPPPKKRARPELQQLEDFGGSDDSFDDPVLEGPSQITQTILQRKSANGVEAPIQQQTERNSLTESSQESHSPAGCLIENDVKMCKPYLRQSVTPGRFSAQDKNDYHQNGQLLMLRNRLENMEREKERLAAATRDQIILIEKHHAAELFKKEERIRQLEMQVQNLRRENLQTSFQAHNATLCERGGTEMIDGGIPVAPLPIKRVVFPRHDLKWKTAVKFGVRASIFSSNLSLDRCESGTRAETFTNIPSQVLMETPVSNAPMQSGITAESAFGKTSLVNENKDCYVDAITDSWDVRKWMCESSLNSLLSISLLSQESNFDVSALSKLCQVKDFLDFKSRLRP